MQVKDKEAETEAGDLEVWGEAGRWGIDKYRSRAAGKKGGGRRDRGRNNTAY